MAMAGRAGSSKKPKESAPTSRTGTDEVTKKALLDATAELLSERSNLEFSQAEVGARSGMSAALVQYHFGSKHGLLAALLEYSSTHYVTQINGLADMTMSATDKLRLHVRGIVTTYTKTPYLDRLLHHLIEASPEEEARRISDFYVGRVIEFYRRLIDQGVAEGVFRRIDPVHLYFILVGTGDHLVARRRLLEPIVGSAGFDSNFARSFGDELFNIVFCGVRAEAATSGDATA
ncbi:MAG: TetR family transcriptional regulator [Novosphingobium sp. PASSN1]|nr:MAG: TetR family transcriptional regulator [Novosphingobium sp. PASSN1]